MNTTAPTSAGHARAHRTLIAGAAALGGAGLLIAGCSGVSSTASSSGAPATHARSGFGAVPAPAQKAAGTGTAANGQTSRLLLSSQSIIYTANLTVRSRDVNTAASRAIRMVLHAGGYLAGEQATSVPRHPDLGTVSLTLKIPVPQYQAVIASLSGLGKRTSLNQQAVNVTQQVADVGSRVTSEQAAIAQLRVLLKRAGSVSELLAVQDQINTDESTLEALLAQQRALQRETSYGTVSLLLLSQRRPPIHHKRTATGFLAGLSGGWRAFVAAVVWLLTAIGAVLPFIIAIAVLAALGIAGRRRLLRRRTRPSATPS
jgi:Domain of unknown function (DUF4349)